MRFVYIGLIVAFTALVLLFKFQNLETVTVSLFSSSITSSGVRAGGGDIPARHVHRRVPSSPCSAAGSAARAVVADRFRLAGAPRLGTVDFFTRTAFKGASS